MNEELSERQMTPEERKNHAYIGDGVYAEFDGFGLILRTGNHQDHKCDNKIYLEDDVLKSLNIFYEHIRAYHARATKEEKK